jgi:DNA helicase-2/ATP-dependent DNA helicase PcrA
MLTSMPSLKSSSRSAPFVPDDRQREAIEHVHGPMLVVAGAGTGKTSVLTHRIERLVCDEHAQPDEILALTYTVNAAREMRERVGKLLGGKTVNAATFHDYCLDMLKRVHRDFGVLDEKDLWIYLRRRMRELRLEHFIRAANVGQFLNDLLEFVSRCHDELITPEKYAQYVERLERGEVPMPRVAKSKNALDRAEVLGRCHEIARVFETMERWLLEENLGTFGHMITRAHALLQSDESVLAEARARARFILADEFQDANLAQIRILTRLAGSAGNLFAVGDPDQSIYRFRGASSAAFALFHRHFPGAKQVALEKNRRSTTPILRSAFALIDQNPPVFAQNAARNAGGALTYHRQALQSAREEEAAKAGTQLPSPLVSAVVLTNRDAEGPDVVAFIRDVQKKLKCKWSDFGILYRSHLHRDDVVHELAKAGIPFVIESMDISDTPEVRDLFACLSAIVSPSDDVSLFRVAALPAFHVNPQQLRQVMRAIARDNREGQVVPLQSALDRVEGGAEVLAAVRRAREEIRRKEAKARAALDIIVKQFGLDAGSPILQAALHFATEWEKKKINKTTELEELVDYLAYFREAGGVIPMESNESENAVRLMTVHGAKGLEFPHVFILRANSNSFPCSYKETLVAFPRELRDADSITEADDKTLHGQEERRLFYVAMTRARDSLHIYSRQGKGKANKNPDGYMRELIENKNLARWLIATPARGSQTSLDIFAEASVAYPAESQTNVWFELPVLEGLESRLSASAVDTYERCGLQFKLERDWRLSAKPAAAMLFGGAIHRVLKTYFDSVTLGRPKTEDELINLFRVDLAEARILEPCQHELYEKQGIAQLQDFLATVSVATPQVLHTEQSFEIHVGQTVVAGRIDRIDQRPDGSVAVVDYKTGKARDQENADESLQLSLYAIAAREKWGYTVGALIFYNLEENVPVLTTRSEGQLLAARERVEAAAQGIAAGVFKAKTGMHCNFCAFRSLCPEKEKRIPRRVESRAERPN